MPKTINLRDLDDGLVKAAKRKALDEDTSLKGYIVGLVEKDLRGSGAASTRDGSKVTTGSLFMGSGHMAFAAEPAHPSAGTSSYAKDSLAEDIQPASTQSGPQEAGVGEVGSSAPVKIESPGSNPGRVAGARELAGAGRGSRTSSRKSSKPMTASEQMRQMREGE